MASSNVRDDVVQKLIEAHQAGEPVFALAAVEFESDPTDAERAAARESVVKLREAALRLKLDETEQGLKELRERLSRKDS